MPVADRHSFLLETCGHVFRTPLAGAGGLLPINALVFTDGTVRWVMETASWIKRTRCNRAGGRRRSRRTAEVALLP